MRTAKTDQTGQMPRLILVFAGRTCHFVGSIFIIAIRRTMTVTLHVNPKGIVFIFVCTCILFCNFVIVKLKFWMFFFFFYLKSALCI